MNRQIMRIAAGANLVAGCLLLQGCGMFGKPKDHTVSELPGGDLPPVEVQIIEPAASASPVEVVPATVETAPVTLPPVASTTPYTIQKGDTISAVAYKYNLRWQDVVAVNPGISPNRLRIGQVIQLPGQIDLSQVRAVPATTPKAPRASAPKVSAPKAAAPAAGSTTTYVVKPGDSLSVIAHRHGIKTADLRAANGIKGDKIIVGQKLKIVGATKTSAGATSAKAATPAAAPKMAAPKATASAPKAETKPQATVAAPPPAPAPAVVETVAPAPVESAPVKVETAAPVTVSPVAADPNVQTYTVKEGEDLYAVAIRWGVSPSDLKSLNNLTGSELKAGSVLKIPGGVR